MQAQSLETRHKRALEIGVLFVKEYFTKLSKDPASAAALYAKDCVFYDLKATYEGAEQVKAYVEKLPGGYKFTFDSVLAQASVGDSVLLTLRGQQHTRTSTVRFSRSFVLARNADTGKYQAQNDVILELRREDDEPSHRAGGSSAKKDDASASASASTTAAASKKEAAASTSAAHSVSSSPPAGGSSWAEKLKAKGSAWGSGSLQTAATPAAAAGGPQRVIGGANADEAARDPVSEKAKAKDAAVKKPGATKLEAAKKPLAAEKASGGSGVKKAGEGHKGGGQKYAPDRFQHAALYVNGLTDRMTESEIDSIFSKYGKIVGKTFRQGEYCFIDFESRTAVQAACSDKV